MKHIEAGFPDFEPLANAFTESPFRNQLGPNRIRV